MIDTIDHHLFKYGLKHFTSQSDYAAWEESALSPDQRQNLYQQHDILEANPSPGSTRTFMDFIAEARIFPVVFTKAADTIKKSGLHVDVLLKGRRAVLDVGCATGYLTTWYALSNPRSQVVGIDISEVCIEIAKERADQLSIENVHFQAVDVALTVPDGPWDVIVGTQSFEFLADSDQRINALAAHLNSKGIMVSVSRNPWDLLVAKSFKAAGLKIRPIKYFETCDLGEALWYGIVVGERREKSV